MVIGAQFGGEGKGKLVSHLSIVDDADIVVRCGGPNSGHTVDYEGFRIGLRMVPAGFVNRRTKLMLAPGALVDPKILFAEMEKCNVDSSRLMIDRNACVVKDEYAKLDTDARKQRVQEWRAEETERREEWILRPQGRASGLLRERFEMRMFN